MLSVIDGSNVMCTVVQMCDVHARTPTFHLAQDPERKQRWLKAVTSRRRILYTKGKECPSITADCF